MWQASTILLKTTAGSLQLCLNTPSMHKPDPEVFSILEFCTDCQCNLPAHSSQLVEGAGKAALNFEQPGDWDARLSGLHTIQDSLAEPAMQQDTQVKLSMCLCMTDGASVCTSADLCNMTHLNTLASCCAASFLTAAFLSRSRPLTASSASRVTACKQ